MSNGAEILSSMLIGISFAILFPMKRFLRKMYSVVSLFAGIGGICLGFKQAGFEIIWANEKDHSA